MAAVALIKFRRDNSTPTTFPDGRAIVGAVGHQIRVWNSSNTDVASWQVDLVYVPPDSVIPVATPLAFSDVSNTPDSGVVTLDATGGYRFVLKVWDVPNRIGAPTSVDIRNVLVPETSGFISPPSALWPAPLPPPQSLLPDAKPEENNINGQTSGWAGTGADGLLTHLIRQAAASAAYVDAAVAAALGSITLANDSVTFAKMQNISTDVLIGRDTAGTGDPGEITLTNGLGFTGSNSIGVSDNGVTNARLADMAVDTVKARLTAGTGDPEDVTLAALAAALGIGGGLADDSVTFAKIQNITTDRLIGRDTAATGDPEEIAVTNGLAFTGSASIGIANQGVTHARYQNIATDRLLGRDTAGTGSPEEVSVTNGLEFTGGTAIGIANLGVTYARMQNVTAGSRVLGRGTSGAGSPEELTVGSGLSFTGATVIGVSDNGISNARLTDMATGTVKARLTAGTGDPEDVTLAALGTALGVGINTARGYRILVAVDGSADTVTTGESTVNFAGTEYLDNAGMFSSAADTRFTCVFPGYYMLKAGSWTTTTAITGVEMTVRINGTTVVGLSYSSDVTLDGLGGPVFWFGYLGPGDYLELLHDADASSSIMQWHAAVEQISDTSGISHCAATVTATVAAVAAVPFSAADTVDTDGYHNPSSNNTRFVAPTTGVYEIWANVFAPAAAVDYELILRVNGSTVVGGAAARVGATGANGTTACTVAALTAGDYVELLAASSGSQSSTVFFYIRRIDPAAENACALAEATVTTNTTQFSIPFASAEILDTDGMHDTVTNNTRVTIVNPGVYEALAVSTGTVGSHEMVLRRNNTTSLSYGTSDFITTRFTVLYWVGSVVAGDYLELQLDSVTSSQTVTARWLVRRLRM